jgi:hypothetical protein
MQADGGDAGTADAAPVDAFVPLSAAESALVGTWSAMEGTRPEITTIVVLNADRTASTSAEFREACGLAAVGTDAMRTWNSDGATVSLYGGLSCVVTRDSNLPITCDDESSANSACSGGGVGFAGNQTLTIVGSTLTWRHSPPLVRQP